MTDKKNDRIHDLEVVVLMAGEGRRLFPLTKDRPKALLNCENGISIFENIVRAFVDNDMTATIIPVVGHGRLKVYEEVVRLSDLIEFKCISNPFYKSAGPLISLWLGLIQSNSERVVILNGDTIIRKSLVENLKQWFFQETKTTRPEIAVCVTETDDLGKDDMKLQLDSKQSFCNVGKDIAPGPNIVKSAGVVCVKDMFSKKALREKLDTILMNNSVVQPKYYWHNILNEINGIFKIDLIKVDESSWHEIDTDFDLNLSNHF